jgi:uncharacterized OB-fold protein
VDALEGFDRDARAWWAAIQEHRLTIQLCGRCGVVRWPARSVCGNCASRAWSWIPAVGTATVASWTVTHHSFGDAVTPYTVVLALLDDGPDLFVPGAFEHRDGTGLSMGTRLVAGFALGSDPGLTVLSWELAVPAGSAESDPEDR